MRIDAARVYSNWGPLCTELALRLAQKFQISADGVVCVSSGTSALIAAILGTSGRAQPNRPLAMLPALTFVATAAAVEQCGFQPYLCDVDAETWMLDPVDLRGHPILSRVGLVVPVAPYGRPVPIAPWTSFQQATDIPVVVDGAASFEALEVAPENHISEIPVALSFHATKSFATGEGGCVLTRSGILGARIARAANFGFAGNRESACPNTNAKMSEYHAAVGLAELDGWAEKRAALRKVAEAYQAVLESYGLGRGLRAAPDVASCYVLYLFDSLAERERAERSLMSARIDFRDWYGRGMQSHPHFSAAAGDPLSIGTAIAQRTLGLPVALDLPESAVLRVVTALRFLAPESGTPVPEST